MTINVRRFVVVTGLGVATAGAILVACGFPSPLLSDIEPQPEADGSTADVTADVQTELDALADVPFVESGTPEGVVQDSGEKIDAAGCPPSDCDCDKDGYNDLEKPGCEDAGGKHDCDDSDSRAHPGQGYLEAPAEPPLNGDWNCNGILEKVFPRVNITCALLSDCTEGFVGNPECGVETDYLYCQAPLGILCSARARGRNTQACK